jgi:uncharacterized membrane protein YGL010W
MEDFKYWMLKYQESHQNKTNIAIHFLCVPLIFISLFYLLYAIPFPEFSVGNFNIQKSAYLNWGILIYYFLLIFWFRLKFKIGFLFLVLGLILTYSSVFIYEFLFSGFAKVPVFIFFIVFVLVWIGQFYGHKIEGKKPSFFDDLKFLLIGPIWVVYKILGKTS